MDEVALGSGSEVDVRRATPEDAEVLTRIALAAKRHWGYPERWILRWAGGLTITPEFVLNNEVHAATVEGGRTVGFYALVGEGHRVELEHLWISPEHMGKGVGRMLFDHALGKAASLGAETLRLEADPNAEGFYRKMGAERVGQNVYEIEGQRRVLPLMALEVGNRRTP